MRNSPNKLWAIGPFFSILMIAIASYLKVPAFRDAVNTRIPWAQEHLSRFVPAPVVVMIGDSPRARIPVVPAAPVEAPVSQPAGAEAVPETPPPIQPQKTRDEPLTLQGFAANRALWPKTVKLRCAIEFPAVLNGKIIGKIKAPAGAETRLVIVKDQQLGLEFRGGGAWVAVSDTDLMEKAKISSR
jgi:hypothetical protein